LEQFRTQEEDVEFMDTLAAYEVTWATVHDEKMPLLANMQPFRNGRGIVGPKGSRYAGGLARPPGATFFEDAVAEPEYADFPDSDDESE
jgi:hypothetical protein